MMLKLEMLIILLRLWRAKFYGSGLNYEVKLVCSSNGQFVKMKKVKVVFLGNGYYVYDGVVISERAMRRRLEREFYLLDTEISFLRIFKEYVTMWGKVGGWRFIVYSSVEKLLRVNAIIDNFNMVRDKWVAYAKVDYDELEIAYGKADVEGMKKEVKRILRIEPLNLPLLVGILWLRLRLVEGRFISFFNGFLFRKIVKGAMRVMRFYNLKKGSGVKLEGLGWNVELSVDGGIATDGMERYVLSSKEIEMFGTIGNEDYDQYGLMMYLSGRVRERVFYKKSKREEFLKGLLSILSSPGEKNLMKGSSEGTGGVLLKYEVMYNGYVSFLKGLKGGRHEDVFCRYFRRKVEVDEGMISAVWGDLVWDLFGMCGLSTYWRVRFFGKLCFSKWCDRRRHSVLLVRLVAVLDWLIFFCGFFYYNGYLVGVYGEYVVLKVKSMILRFPSVFTFGQMYGLFMYYWDCFFRGVEVICYWLYMGSVYQLKVLYLKWSYESLKKRLVRSRLEEIRWVEEECDDSYEIFRLEKEEDEEEKEDRMINTLLGLEDEEGYFFGRHRMLGNYGDGEAVLLEDEESSEELRLKLDKNKERTRYRMGGRRFRRRSKRSGL